ncbi:MAG: PIN domain-containing protein [Crocosphaera sp.]|nr:PIN domain-containing protein [Crocosphaera sp.]
MKDRYLIDTNIWVYAHLKELGNNKHNSALSVLETLPILVSSTQVLNEYYSVMLKKKVEDVYIQDNIEVIIDIAEIQLIQLKTIRLAHEFKLKYRFSYWDSLVLASAMIGDCEYLLTEDLQDNQIITYQSRQIKVINPFTNKL